MPSNKTTAEPRNIVGNPPISMQKPQIIDPNPLPIVVEMLNTELATPLLSAGAPFSASEFKIGRETPVNKPDIPPRIRKTAEDGKIDMTARLEASKTRLGTRMGKAPTLLQSFPMYIRDTVIVIEDMTKYKPTLGNF